MNRYLDAQEAQLARDRATLIRKVPRGWARERERLLKDLVTGLRNALIEPFAVLLEETVGTAAARLDSSMRAQSTAKEMHATRIEVKSLRYLLEPLQGTHLGASAVLKHLRVLQDVYGAFSDHEVLLRRLESAMNDVSEHQAAAMYELSTRDQYDAVAYAGLRRADPAPALAATARMVSARHRELYQQILGYGAHHPGFATTIAGLFEAPAAPEEVEDRAS